MKKNKSAFTMIELLMVMMITSILGSVMLTNFLDFRKEAKVAALQEDLQAIRVAVKNQRLQAKLRCNYNGDGTEANEGDYSFFYMNKNYLWGKSIYRNDITYAYPVAGDPTSICTTAQIPNPADRKYLQDGLPRNPFRNTPGAPYLYIIDLLWLSTFGTHCAAAAFCTGLADWALDTSTGEIFPCSDTPGVNECNF